MIATKENRPGEGAAQNLAGGSGDSSAYLSALARRRAFTSRMMQLEHGVRDPWTDRPKPEGRPDALADALAHLDRHGLTGRATIDQLRAAWATAGPDTRPAIERAAQAVAA